MMPQSPSERQNLAWLFVGFFPLLLQCDFILQRHSLILPSEKLLKQIGFHEIDTSGELDLIQMAVPRMEVLKLK